MRRFIFLSCIAALTLFGCDSGSSTTVDSGPSTTPDSGTPGTPAEDGSTGMMMGGGNAPTLPTGIPGLMAHDGTAEVAADLSCWQMNALPTGTDGSISWSLQSPAISGALMPVTEAGVTVNFFTDNAASDTCGDGCVTATSAAGGTGSSMLPAGGWVAIDAQFSGNPIFRTVTTNAAVPSDGTELSVVGLASATFNAAVGVTGLSYAGSATNGLGLATAYDCAGNRLMNVWYRILNTDGSEVTLNAGGGIVYWAPAALFPSAPAALEWTGDNGRMAAVNVPSSAGVLVEAWGSVDGTATLIGCEPMSAVGDALNITTVNPLRSDAPAGCTAQ